MVFALGLNTFRIGLIEIAKQLTKQVPVVMRTCAYNPCRSPWNDFGLQSLLAIGIVDGRNC